MENLFQKFWNFIMSRMLLCSNIFIFKWFNFINDNDSIIFEGEFSFILVPKGLLNIATNIVSYVSFTWFYFTVISYLLLC